MELLKKGVQEGVCVCVEKSKGCNILAVEMVHALGMQINGKVENCYRPSSWLLHCFGCMVQEIESQHPRFPQKGPKPFLSRENKGVGWGGWIFGMTCSFVCDLCSFAIPWFVEK